MEKQETVYYCKQGEPTCVYPKCVCNAARPKEEPKEETLENFLMFNKLFGEIYETNEKKVMEQIKTFFCNEQGNN